MADDLEINLKLNDQVSASANKAADALAKVESSAAKAQSALNFKGQSDAIGKASKGWTGLNDKAEAAAKKLADKQAKAQISATEKAQNAIQKAEAKRAQGFANLWAKVGMDLARKQARAKEIAHHGESWLGEGVEEFGGKLKKAVAAAAIAELIIKGVETAFDIVKEGVVETFRAGAREEKQTLAFKTTFGGTKEGAEAQEEARRISKLTQFTTGRTEDMVLKLKRAGFSDTGRENAIAAAGDVEAGGGNRAEDTLEILKRIQLKGGVSKKELIGLNQNVPEFYKALGAKLGVSDKEAEKKSKEGGIDPVIFQNLLYKGIEKAQHGQLGTTTNKASKTLEARFEKLQELPEEYLKKMSKSPAWQVLSDKVGLILEGLDPDSEKGKKIQASLFKVFDKVATTISNTLTPENISKFGDAVESAVNFLTKIPDILRNILDVSLAIGAAWSVKQIGGGISSAKEAMGGFAEGVKTAGENTGGVRAGLNSMLSLSSAVSLAAGAWVLAFQKANETATELGGWSHVWGDLKEFATGKGPAVSNDHHNFTAKYNDGYGPQDDPSKPTSPLHNSTPVTISAPLIINVDGSTSVDAIKNAAQDHGPRVESHVTRAMQQRKGVKN